MAESHEDPQAPAEREPEAIEAEDLRVPDVDTESVEGGISSATGGAGAGKAEFDDFS